MLITPGPLLIQPNERGDALWLRDPSRPESRAVASVWRQGSTEFRIRAPGNAAVMAYAGRLYDLVEVLSVLSTKEALRQAVVDAQQLIADIKEEADQAAC